MPVQRLFTDVLFWAQTELNEQRRQGKLALPMFSAASEHLYFEQVRLQADIEARPQIGLTALVSGCPGDDHFLAGRVAADLFRLGGWIVEFIGARADISEVLSYFKEKRAALLCLTVIKPEFAQDVKDLLVDTEDSSSKRNVILLGPAFAGPADPELPPDIRVLADFENLLSIARSLCGVFDAEDTLPLFLARLGATVQQARRSKHLSQQQLADAAHLDRAYISAVENGKQNISIGAIAKLARALDVGLDQLLRSDINHSPTLHRTRTVS